MARLQQRVVAEIEQYAGAPPPLPLLFLMYRVKRSKMMLEELRGEL